MLDHTRISQSNGGDFDLFGIHEFQRLNDWLYAGVGAFARMVERNAGNWFVNGGLASGAGGRC
jgi:hypothetical protein